MYQWYKSVDMLLLSPRRRQPASGDGRALGNVETQLKRSVWTQPDEASVAQRVIYREGVERAFLRLREHIVSSTPDDSVPRHRALGPILPASRGCVLAASPSQFAGSGHVVVANRLEPRGFVNTLQMTVPIVERTADCHEMRPAGLRIYGKQCLLAARNRNCHQVLLWVLSVLWRLCIGPWFSIPGVARRLPVLTPSA
ncbi:hypothetical protein MAPG_05920 [Magnaporthiopsis poae ATCC 64411]|uniref:Uncharacterized protein n=1 Tax=Magnaporthiopsis poae (strain ATCC 64411 / 73-15) TaxID=644358 RepID=A0A0C4E0N9_MAGP6|nr:hypothetical protein MAPG_05920 [Magnaporthiopsis poae ATCC 64411]